MSDKKYAIVQISGGLGKHIALTAGLQAIKNNYPDREIIAVVAWPELFANLPMVLETPKEEGDNHDMDGVNLTTLRDLLQSN